MPSGYKDWHKGVKADIIAQTLEKIAVDIVASSIGNLPIDIKAQTISNLDIDIAAQTIERLIQSPSYGGARQFHSSTGADPDVETLIGRISGSGIIYGGYLFWQYDEANPYDEVKVVIDGNDCGSWFIEDLAKWHIDSGNMWWFVVHYRSATDYIGILKCAEGITFEEEFAVYFTADPDGGSKIVELTLIYALR